MTRILEELINLTVKEKGVSSVTVLEILHLRKVSLPVVSVSLFSNRSLLVSKCGKNKKAALTLHQVSTSSVIYYSTDPKQNGMSSIRLKEQNIGNGDVIYAFVLQ